MITVTKKVTIPTILRGITYDMYLKIRDDPRNRGYRMTFYDGTLEFTSPEFRHDKGARRIGMIVNAYTAILGVECQGSRSTTFRRGLPGKLKGKGKEPDESFYFTDAALIRDKDTIDLDVDPPPDLWVEVDNRNSSKGRLPLYAALGVKEVWRYRPRSRRLWIGLLEECGYVESGRSHFLPKLTPEIVLRLLHEATSQGEPAWDNWMRDWMRTTLRDTNPGADTAGPTAPAR